MIPVLDREQVVQGDGAAGKSRSWSDTERDVGYQLATARESDCHTPDRYTSTEGLQYPWDSVCAVCLKSLVLSFLLSRSLLRIAMKKLVELSKCSRLFGMVNASPMSEQRILGSHFLDDHNPG